MKNFLTILGLACFLSASVCIEAKAQTDTSSDINCTGGTVIKAKDGRSFCMSKFGMTWWSAYDWCRSHGLTMATLDDCTYNNKTYRSTAICNNLVGFNDSNWLWTNTYISKNSVYCIEIKNGRAEGDTKEDYRWLALCK